MDLRRFFSKKNAYTLAEVLLVAFVVGVIAIVSLAVLKVTDSKKYPTARAIFKNEFAESLAAMNAEVNLQTMNDESFINNLKNYFDSSSKCTTSTCFGNRYTDESGANVTIPTYKHTFQTKGGVSVSLSYVSNPGVTLPKFVSGMTKDSYEFSNAALNFVTGVFDVNGSAGPNKIGEDMGIIMPSYSLNKTTGEYFTFSGGSVVAKNKSGGSKTLVDSNGKFLAENADAAAISACKTKNTNMTLDDYGDCSLCTLTRAACAKKGKQFNKSSCKCEHNISCPKGQILKQVGSEVKCACKDTLTADPSNKYQGAWNEKTCSFNCKVSDNLKCIANGGKWNSKTCSCDCGSATTEGSAEQRCKAKSKYAAANKNNLCACECVEGLFSVPAEYADSTEYNSNLGQKCFKCKNLDSGLIPTRDDSKGYCTATCSDTVVSKYKAWSDNNKKFWKPADGYDTTHAKSCNATCVLTDKTCQSLFTARLRSESSQCPKLHYVKTKLSKFGLNSDDNCDSDKISVKADTKSCRCVLSYPSGYLGRTTRTTARDLYFHGKFNILQVWYMRYTGTGTLAANAEGNPNRFNPEGSIPLGPINVSESFSSAYDPILLIIPNSSVPSPDTAPAMKNGQINAVMSDGGSDISITWIGEARDASNPTYYFLVKDNNTGKPSSLENKMFTDLGHNTGIDELFASYNTYTTDESNSEPVINPLDFNFDGTLYLWSDINADGVVQAGEIKTLNEKHITAIYKDVTLVSDTSGRSRQSDKAITSIEGIFSAAIYPIDVNKEECSWHGPHKSCEKVVWIKRVVKDNEMLYVHEVEVPGTDADGNSVTDTKSYYYRYNRKTGSFHFVSHLSSGDDPLKDKPKRRYVDYGDSGKFAEKEYKLIDILFKESNALDEED